MSNEEITKALGLCFNINDNAGLNCGECPYKERTECSLNLYSDTIDLINRQQAEIEKMKIRIEAFDKAFNEVFPPEMIEKAKEMVGADNG